jgi:hypothetical protein
MKIVIRARIITTSERYPAFESAFPVAAVLGSVETTSPPAAPRRETAAMMTNLMAWRRIWRFLACRYEEEAWLWSC